MNRLSHPALDTGMLEEKLAFQEFIAERFTHHDGLANKNVYYLNGAINFTCLRDMQTFFLRIKKKAEKTHFIRNFEELVDAYSKNFENATHSCYASLGNMPLIIESFNDAAYPFSQADDCDTVLCVASNTILKFEANRYFDAVEALGKEKPKLQLTVSQVYASSMIKDKFIVQPLMAGERNDPARLTQNYSEIIKTLTEKS